MSGCAPTGGRRDGVGAAGPLPRAGRYGHRAVSSGSSTARALGAALALTAAGLNVVGAPEASPAAGAEPAPATSRVTARDLGRAVLVETELPGAVLGLAPRCGADRRCRGLWLLVRPADDPRASDRSDGEAADDRSDGETARADGGGAAAGEPPAVEFAPPRLLLLDPARAAAGDSAAALTASPVSLPPEADALALADLDGDGAAELIAGAPGRIWSLGEPTAPRPPRPAIADPALDLAAVGALLDPALPRFPMSAVGRLRWFAPVTAGGLGTAGAATLPVRTRRRDHGLELSSPRPDLLPAGGGEPPRWAVGPEARGHRRLRSLVIDPLAGDGGASTEYWSLLPAPERVETARYVRLDGRPALAVFTFAADKLGIFDQARLRLFRLEADRTRAGSAPALAVDTTSHRWHHAAVAIADFDADGHDDVAVAQVKGLGGKAILIETYRGLGGGRFARRPAVVRLDTPEASWRWLDGPHGDLDGDRLPDLIALSRGRLLLYASTGRRAGAALAETPRWEIAWPPEADRSTDADHPDVAVDEEQVEVEVEAGNEGARVRADHRFPRLGGLPATLDLDGDLRPELIFRHPLPHGRERLRIVLLH